MDKKDMTENCLYINPFNIHLQNPTFKRSILTRVLPNYHGKSDGKGLFGCFQKIVVPQNGWLKIMENPINPWDDLGGFNPPVSETAIYSYQAP